MSQQPPNYGPPPQGYGPPQGQWGPPPPPKKKHTVRNVILGIIGAIIVIAIISSAASSSSKSDSTTAKKETSNTDTGKSDKGTKSTTDHSEDAVIMSCTKDSSTGLPTAKVKVTNNSSKSSNYIVTVSFNNGSEQIDTGIAAINNLNPGSSNTQEATSLKTDSPSSFTCKIEDTTRYSAVG
jgi:hypothetical protein